MIKVNKIIYNVQTKIENIETIELTDEEYNSRQKKQKIEKLFHELAENENIIKNYNSAIKRKNELTQQIEEIEKE